MIDVEKTLHENNNRIPWHTAEIRATDQTDVGIIVFEVARDSDGSVKDWIFKSLNPVILEAIGESAEQIIPKKVTEIFGSLPQLDLLISDSNEVMRTKKVVCYEMEFPWNRKTYILKLHSLNTNFLLTVITDITKHKQLRDKLFESRDLLENIIDSTPSAVFARDLAGRITLANEAFALSVNMMKEECIGKTYDECYTKKVIEILTSGEQRAIANEMPYQSIETIPFYGEMLTMYTTKFPLRNASGQICGLGGVITNITEIKRNEEKLKYHANLIDSISDAVISTDQFFTIKTWNRAAETIYGWTAEQAVGKDINALLNIQFTGSCFKEAFNELKQNGSLEVEDIHYGKDGAIIHVLVHIKIQNNVYGEITGTVATIRNITERKRIQQELKAANAQLLEADQRKNQFLGVLSHELRNPLASIQNCLHLLNKVEFSNEQAHRAKEIMERQVSQLSRLVNDLLDITRITQNKIKLQIQQLEINEAIRLIVEDYRALFAENGVELDVDYDSPLFIDADETRFVQVVGNLLHNAVKFTRRGDQVRLIIRSDSDLKQAFIRLIDTGVGMAPEIVANLFQPFVQADTSLDRSLGGLGLGLALVKGLVELHGGQVGGFSEGVGKGSEFWVRFPLVPSQPVAEKENGNKEPPVSRRILIIDDNKDFCETLSELLKVQDHEVLVAFSGSEGLRRAEEFRPEVIICDIGLPEINGYEVAKTLRRNPDFQDTYLIAMSGYATTHDSLHAIEAGFNKHCAKPLDIKVLTKILGRVDPEQFSK